MPQNLMPLPAGNCESSIIYVKMQLTSNSCYSTLQFTINLIPIPDWHYTVSMKKMPPSMFKNLQN